MISCDHNSIVWEQRKFSDVGTVSMCKRVFKEQTSAEGDIPFFKIGTFGSEPDAFISRELFEDYKAKFSYPKAGDILLSASGTIGRIVEYKGEEAYFQDSNIVWLSHDDSISNSFLKVLYPTVKWDGIEGSTIQRLYNENFLKTKFVMPSRDEQDKLGEYFGSLDNLITLHQRKLFQQIHESSVWEQRKLGEQMYIKSRIGWQALTRNEYLETGDYYLITGTDIDESSHTVDLKRCYYVSKERYEMDDKIQVREGDIIVTKDGTIGKVAMVTGLDKPATLNSHLFVLRDLSGNLDNRYLLQILNSHIFDAFVNSTKTGSALTGLPQKTFVEFQFPAPSYEEQKRVASFFDNLDNLITLHRRA